MYRVENSKLSNYLRLYGLIAVYMTLNIILYLDWFMPMTRVLTLLFFLLAAGVFMIRKNYVLSQFLMILLSALYLYVYVSQIHYFHFYGSLLLLLFFAVILCLERWLMNMVYILSLALMIYRSYIVWTWAGDNETLAYFIKDHLFISVSIVFVAALTVYMDRLSIKESKEKRMLAHSSEVDLLTGTYTRSRLNSDVASVPLIMGSYNMAILDIDLFKAINDTYGHETGDHMLVSLAKDMMATFSEPGYKIYRWGGEEFVIIGREEPAKGFNVRLDAFREATDRDYLGAKVHMTVSIGSVWVDGNESFEHAFNRCDDALYQAKNSGRNRLVEGGVV